MRKGGRTEQCVDGDLLQSNTSNTHTTFFSTVTLGGMWGEGRKGSRVNFRVPDYWFRSLFVPFSAYLPHGRLSNCDLEEIISSCHKVTQGTSLSPLVLAFCFSPQPYRRRHSSGSFTMVLASRSATVLSALRQLGSGPAVASSSRSVAVAFSTSSTSYAAPNMEQATARKGPFTSAAEASPASTERNATGRGRKSAGRGRPKMLAPFDEWIHSDARVYKHPKPGMGPNWIGDTPFPLNPSFNPPPPVRQGTKAEIWRLHTSNPAQWTIRALSEKFSIGLQRMEAILRLQALESEWTSQVRTSSDTLQSFCCLTVAESPR